MTKQKQIELTFNDVLRIISLAVVITTPIILLMMLWDNKLTNDLVINNSENKTNWSEYFAPINYSGNLKFAPMKRTFEFKVMQSTREIATFSSDFNNVTINGNICKEVICECAKKNPACMSICYYCKGEKQ